MGDGIQCLEPAVSTIPNNDIFIGTHPEREINTEPREYQFQKP